MCRLKNGLFWLAVLLALPNCSIDRTGLLAPQNLDRGDRPWSDAVFCEIPTSERRCASTLTDAQRASAIRLSEAAIALVEGRSSTIGLDDSEEAMARCSGEPEAVFFEGEFPKGLHVCLNCGVLETGGPYAHDANLVCRNRCYDFHGATLEESTSTPLIPPSDAVRAFCDANARVATNMDPNRCFAGVCDDGMLRSDFSDSRRFTEPVIWTNLIGTTAEGTAFNTLTRAAPFTGMNDAGAVSQQWIEHDDAFVEFGVTRNHQLGFTEIPAGCAPPCDDTDPDIRGITLAMDFGGTDGRVYIFEGGVKVDGPDVNGSFGTYAPGDRFRISLRANRASNVATITYSRLIGACTPGTVCNLSVLRAHPGTVRYPVRVDTSLQEPGTSLTDVRIARVK